MIFQRLRYDACNLFTGDFSQNFSDRPTISKNKPEDLISFSSPNKVCPSSSIPPHMMSNSSLQSLGGEFEVLDHSTDTSQTDDLISFTSNDFSVDHIDDVSSRRDEESVDIKDTATIETSSSADEKRANIAVAKKPSNVPEYKVNQNR